MREEIDLFLGEIKDGFKKIMRSKAVSSILPNKPRKTPMEIIPAIIPKNFADLKEKMSLVEGLASIVQIDVMDGSLTRQTCWPYAGDGEDFVKILKGEEEFPQLETDFEVDLMVKSPELFIENWLIAGAKRIVVHFEGMKDVNRVISIFREKSVGADNTLLRNFLGLGVNIETPNEKIYPLLPQFDFVQFMGIKKIGSQGQLFDEKVLEKISKLKRNSPETPVSVDGGVNLENAKKLVEAGADRLVIGSAIFESENIAETFERFKDVIK